ncbi:MAG: S1C family serine protease [Acidimicrobiales bacterium]
MAALAALVIAVFPGGHNSRRSAVRTYLVPVNSSRAVMSPPKSASAIARMVDPAVVDIDTINQTDTGYALAAATGVVVSSDGYIVTNNHVVNLATSIKVRIDGHAQLYRASFVGADPAADVAVIKVDVPGSLRAVHLSRSPRVAVGEPVVAIGNAFGRGGAPAVTTGRISALGRSISAGDVLSSSPEQLSGLIVTSARTRPGNSGGPLVNAKGQVIGMNTATSRSGTLGYALPMSRVTAIVSAIESGRSGAGVVLGLRAFLGVVVRPPRAAATATGVLVTRIVLGDPAAEAGIEPGDTIVSFDGRPTPTVSVLSGLVKRERPGASATVTFDAPSGQRTVVVRLIEGPAP